MKKKVQKWIERSVIKFNEKISKLERKKKETNRIEFINILTSDERRSIEIELEVKEEQKKKRLMFQLKIMNTQLQLSMIAKEWPCFNDLRDRIWCRQQQEVVIRCTP